METLSRTLFNIIVAVCLSVCISICLSTGDGAGRGPYPDHTRGYVQHHPRREGHPHLHRLPGGQAAGPLQVNNQSIKVIFLKCFESDRFLTGSGSSTSESTDPDLFF